MNSLARRHHTVPRFYLERFAASGQIGAARLANGAKLILSVKRAATEIDFYMLTGLDGQRADLFEQELSRIEGDTARIFKTILDDGIWPLEPEDRAVLAEFLTLQFVRGPNHRNHLSEWAGLLLSANIAVGGRDRREAQLTTDGTPPEPANVDHLWEMATRPTGIDLKVSAGKHIQQMLKSIPELVKYIAGRPWALIQFERKHLITSDTPIVLIPNADDDPYQGVGLMTAGAIAIPLSRTTALVMRDPIAVLPEGTHVAEVWESRYDIRAASSARLANSLNWHAAHNGRQWLYHHPEDQHILPDPLPEAVEAEIGYPEDTDFAAMGEAMRASQAARKAAREAPCEGGR